MNGIKYLADTNCFIYLLNQHHFMLPFIEDIWAFSYITEIELLSKKNISESEEIVVRELLDTCVKVNHSQALTELVINLRRKYNIKVPDAIIAASALLLQLPLITADKGLANISEINCILLDF